MNVKFYITGRHFTSNGPHISSLLPPCASLLWLGKHRIEHTSLTSNVREAKKRRNPGFCCVSLSIIVYFAQTTITYTECVELAVQCVICFIPLSSPSFLHKFVQTEHIAGKNQNEVISNLCFQFSAIYNFVFFSRV